MRNKKLDKIIKGLERLAIYLIEDVPLRRYGITFVYGVVVFGLFYFFLTPVSHGIGTNNMPTQNLTFTNALYFSIVTVSSLGYGDMHPMGFSKILACLEVLSGLVLMGIMLAKMTSARLSYHVTRLFSSEIQKRIGHFVEEFEKLRIQTSNFSQAIAPIPGKKPALSQSKAVNECTNTVSAFHRHSHKLADYIAYEVEHCKFFSIAPTDAVASMAEAINQAIFFLSLMITGMTPEARRTLLTPANRKQLLEAVDKNKEICWMIREHCTNKSIRQEFSEILKICESFPENLFAVPILVAEETQPDQTLEKSNEPQHGD